MSPYPCRQGREDAYVASSSDANIAIDIPSPSCLLALSLLPPDCRQSGRPPIKDPWVASGHIPKPPPPPHPLHQTRGKHLSDSDAVDSWIENLCIWLHPALYAAVRVTSVGHVCTDVLAFLVTINRICSGCVVGEPEKQVIAGARPAQFWPAAALHMFCQIFEKAENPSRPAFTNFAGNQSHYQP